MTERLREDVVEAYRLALESKNAGEIAALVWESSPTDAESAEAERRRTNSVASQALRDLERDDPGGTS